MKSSATSEVVRSSSSLDSVGTTAKVGTRGDCRSNAWKKSTASFVSGTATASNNCEWNRLRSATEKDDHSRWLQQYPSSALSMRLTLNCGVAVASTRHNSCGMTTLVSGLGRRESVCLQCQNSEKPEAKMHRHRTMLGKFLNPANFWRP